MVITRIESQKTRSRRVNIYCDGEFALGLHQDVLVKFGLREGDVLDEKQIEKLQGAEELNLAKEKALRLLGYRRRSEKELRARLLEREFHPEIIDSVIEHLRKLGFVNDRAFAEAFLHDALMKKPAGTRLLRQELRRKGISKEIVEGLLEEKLGTEIEFSLAREAASKRMRRSTISHKGGEREKQQKRLADFLVRRGFAWDTVASVLKEFFPNS